jgi:hypothetical protein
MTKDFSKFWCGASEHVRPSRRDVMYVGLMGGLGLTLGKYFSVTGSGGGLARGEQKFYESKEGVAKSVIHIFLPGGMAGQESFDPKPLAPVEYRGPMGTVPTKLSGEVFGESLKHTAQVADKLTVVRSMTHGEAAHDRGTHNMFTGYRPSPALSFPSFGSVVSHEFGSKNNMPPYIFPMLMDRLVWAPTRRHRGSKCRTSICRAALTIFVSHVVEASFKRWMSTSARSRNPMRSRRWTAFISGHTG